MPRLSQLRTIVLMSKSLARDVLSTKSKALIRDVLKRLFWLLGFELAEKGSIARSMATVLDVAKSRGLAPATIIDIGVAYGTAELYSAFPQAQLLLVEPVREWEDQLLKLTRNRKTEIVWSAAGTQSSVLTINLFRDLGATSLLREQDDLPESTREVPVERVDEICSRFELPKPYLLKIDVQGAELDVLVGSEGILQFVDMIIVEVCLQKFFQGGSEFTEIFTWLDRHDFCLFDVCGSYCSPRDGTLQQIDIAAVPKSSRLRSLNGLPSH